VGGLTLTGLAWRGLRHYRRTAWSVGLGTAVAAAVLTGALLVGDSVRFSLRQFALQRLGRTQVALPLVHRQCRQDLVRRLAQALPDLQLAGVLKLPGVAMTGEDDEAGKQVNRIDVLGVSGDFWAFALGGTVELALSGQDAAVGQRLADALGVKAGDEISVRIAKPSLLPRQAPLASRKDRLSVRARLRIVKVLADDQMGRFSLAANQVAPHNLFVSLDWLQERVDLAGRVNTILAASRQEHEPPEPGEISRALRAGWEPADAGLTWKRAPGDAFAQLESDRVYLDTPVAEALAASGGVGTLTYLVNGIEKVADGVTNATPYSFVVACAPSPTGTLSPVPPEMKDDEIRINRWLADHLKAAAGDRLRVSFYELTDTGRFEVRSRTFTVRDILTMESLKTEAALVPRFPGLTDVNSCREWDIGMPMEEALLRDADNEAYWQRYRTTPKAFITLAAGQAMWSNRFGNLTGLRYGGNGAALDAELRAKLDPASLGFVFVPVREHALRAVEQGMDFGGLFLGMSFFLIVAALLLTAMLFAFGVEQRSDELGVLASVGYRPRDLRRLVLSEGALQALFGAAIGAYVGTLYTRALVYGLAHYWRDAVAGAAIRYHAEAGTLAVGMVASVVCALLALAVAAWRQSKRSPRELLELDASLTANDMVSRVRRGRIAPVTAWLCGLGALAMVAWVVAARPDGSVEVFFGAGALLLIAGLAGTKVLLGRLDSASRLPRGLHELGRRNVARRSGRSLAVTALLACGGFIVFAVSAMKQDAEGAAHRRDSGAGGYALYAEASFDVPDDIGTVKGRRALIADPDNWPSGLSVVSLKAHEGDDASCFNLNRAQSPRLLGVDPEHFVRVGAFGAGAGDDPWDALDRVPSDGAIPALAGDGNTLMYGLGRKTGDVLTLRDERGSEFKVRIVGAIPHAVTIFQGTLLMRMEAFNARFPSAGYRVVLVDSPASASAEALASVQARMQRAGFDVTTTGRRLAEFHSVEETYLNMFLVLGGLGLLLGSLGLGIMVFRNVFERRGELAMLRCMGFRRAEVAAMVAAEHLLLLALGLGVGVGSSAVAIWPSLMAPGVEIPYGVLAVLLLGMAGAGFAWTLLASRLALRGNLVAAIRNE
jgi:ABC-type lipoprotein release transport system permease subunit